MVSLTLTLFECGSVQMKPASTRCTLDSPLSLFRHTARSSLDSSVHVTHVAGGWRYLYEHGCCGKFLFLIPYRLELISRHTQDPPPSQISHKHNIYIVGSTTYESYNFFVHSGAYHRLLLGGALFRKKCRVQWLPFTSLAEVELCLFWNALCDVHSCAETGHTHVGRVGLNRGATFTAQTRQTRAIIIIKL